jgi:electron transfer flavoprotein beta subunit
MKAKRKPLEVIDLADLNIAASASIATLKTSAPPQRQAGIKVESSEALVAELKARNLV